jgi:uncharacterized protein
MTELARGVEDLTRAACWGHLRAGQVGRLAVVVGQHPDIFPINYLVDDETVVFRTSEGTKLAAAVLGRAVAFEVDGFDARLGDAWSVVVKGRAVELGTMAELFDAEDLPLFPWHDSHKPRWVRIRPDEVTGRRFEARH